MRGDADDGPAERRATQANPTGEGRSGFDLKTNPTLEESVLCKGGELPIRLCSGPNLKKNRRASFVTFSQKVG